MGRKRTLTDAEREESRKRARSNFQIKMAEACNRVLEEIQANPPHLLCWLKGGVNLERANKIREELENLS
jgi:hypothetical protein